MILLIIHNTNNDIINAKSLPIIDVSRSVPILAGVPLISVERGEYIAVLIMLIMRIPKRLRIYWLNLLLILSNISSITITPIMLARMLTQKVKKVFHTAIELPCDSRSAINCISAEKNIAIMLENASKYAEPLPSLKNISITQNANNV